METVDIFDDKYLISYYRGTEQNNKHFDKVGVQVRLRDFLQSTQHKDAVLYGRTLITNEKKYKAYKQTMPSAVIAGVCVPTCSDENTQLNGLMSFDIDSKDNPSITNWEGEKIELSKIPQIAWLSKSFGGQGLWGIIPLKYPQYWERQWEQLKEDFAKYGIILDKKCGNKSRRRFVTYDEQPYYNPTALPYERMKVPHWEATPTPRLQPLSTDADTTERKVAQYVKQIVDERIDLTTDYNVWVRLGFSLSTLGEAGRQYYNAISSIFERYTEDECNKQFDDALRNNRQTGIGTFFFYCHQAGIYLSKPHDAPQMEKQPEVEQLPTDDEKSQYKPNVRELQEKLQLQEVAPDTDAKPKSIIVPIVEFVNGKAVPTNGTYELDADRLPDNYSEGDKLLAYWDFKYHPDDPLQIKGLGKNPPQKAI